jgi:hypothetical protein
MESNQLAMGLDDDSVEAVAVKQIRVGQPHRMAGADIDVDRIVTIDIVEVLKQPRIFSVLGVGWPRSLPLDETPSIAMDRRDTGTRVARKFRTENMIGNLLWKVYRNVRRFEGF